MNLRKVLYSIGLPLLLLLSIVGFAQERVITGRITDGKGAAVSGVTVTVKGTNRGTTTSEDGRYSLSVPSNATTLVFSSVGFSTQELSITGLTSGDLMMESSAGNLNEVVVVGYGTQRRKDVSGAVTTISSKDFVRGQITTPEQLIAGKVAGVSISSNGGAPGAGSTIRIRGGASLNASNDPLIVIDGVPLDNNNIAGAPNALSLINPNDIESFNILKDASAAAIYGSRASNGVILITTKKGRSGTPTFNFNTQLTVGKRMNLVDVLSPQEFRAYVLANGNASQKDMMGSANTNWQEEIYQTAIGSDNNFGVSGGIAGIPFRASLGYLNQMGILRTGTLQRTSAGINLSPVLFNNSLRIDVNLKGSLSNSRFANQGAIGAAASFDPTQPVRVGSKRYGGYFEFLDPGTITGLRALTPRNPVGLLEQRNDVSDVQRSIGNIVFDYKIPFLRSLRANLNLGYDISKGEGNITVNDSAASQYKRFLAPNGVYHGGTSNEYNQNKRNQLMEFYLNYAENIPSLRSRIDILGGYAYQDFRTRSDNFPDRTFNRTVVTNPPFPREEFQNTLISFYGRMNYTIMDRYVLTATVRRDGSSRFSPENRWGTFPSFAAAWRIKEESFLKNSNVFSELKLRGGYGITGQQDGIGLYDYITYYSLSNQTAQYQMGDQFYSMFRPQGYYANRKWEQTATSNIGLEYGLFKNRVTGSIEYYFKRTTDLLNEIVQPAGTNFSNRIVANIGSMENRGVEFNINTDVIRSSDLTWSVNFNATYNKNEITKLTISDDPSYRGAQYGGIAGGTGQTLFIHSTGFNRGSFFVYQQVYGKDGKPIDGMFEDRNRDGVVNDLDLYQYKGVDPQAFFGFSSDLSYKNWNAGFVMRANVGNYIYNNINSNRGTRNAVFGNGFLSNAYSDLLYTNFTGTAAGFSLSDYYIQNASFLRMDNINFGYNVGRIYNNKANLRLSANIQNVFVVTKYKGLDPEISGGVDNNFYPRPRTFVFGINLDF
jgi:TonB-dependent starch-binding outer membrane protein SusC